MCFIVITRLELILHEVLKHCVKKKIMPFAMAPISGYQFTHRQLNSKASNSYLRGHTLIRKYVSCVHCMYITRKSTSS